MKAKCYLSGPVSNQPTGKVRAQFMAAQILVKDAFQAVNPTENVKPDEDWGKAMIKCLNDLLDCQAILMLPGWQESPGARIERDFAERIGMRILTIEDVNPRLHDCECDETLVVVKGYEACVMCGRVREAELKKEVA
ncbi:DUF4406 domain-containing protein [Marinifilum flexuosum]|uniref:Uncharacterized protein DUF4406 n=1 Tax=Marinifilum flexuosum TaxID=1117708 RepID=A0A419X3P7_9BACT|nr:DUF4406 domain-containing protein [Marinifilum flexuosum]RKE02332.1 uncharacterized protein DUF4406 [Marinifilum flexuosum]